jgi:hypothetical protein
MTKSRAVLGLCPCSRLRQRVSVRGGEIGQACHVGSCTQEEKHQFELEVRPPPHGCDDKLSF